MSSSSSDDSRISDLGQDELANKDISSDDSDFEPSKTEPNNDKIYDFDPTASSSPVVKIPLKRKGGLITPNSSFDEKPKKKAKIDATDQQEKENNKQNTKLSWPEQLARSKASRNSVDSLDSLEMELTNESVVAMTTIPMTSLTTCTTTTTCPTSGTSTTAATSKTAASSKSAAASKQAAIVLPILGKKKSDPTPKGRTPLKGGTTSKGGATPLTSKKGAEDSASDDVELVKSSKRGSGGVKGGKKSDLMPPSLHPATSVDQQPPELEPQVSFPMTVPPIKKRASEKESSALPISWSNRKEVNDQHPVSKPKSKKGSSKTNMDPAGGTSSEGGTKGQPKQMSIMAFVQKKKEEALEKRITTGYLSPASSSVDEDAIKDEVGKDKVAVSASEPEHVDVLPIKTSMTKSVGDEKSVEKPTATISDTERLEDTSTPIQDDQPTSQPNSVKSLNTKIDSIESTSETSLVGGFKTGKSLTNVGGNNTDSESKRSDEEIEVLSNKDSGSVKNEDVTGQNKSNANSSINKTPKVKKAPSKEAKTTEDEFENMGYISGDEGYAEKSFQPPAPILTQAASEEELEPVINDTNVVNVDTKATADNDIIMTANDKNDVDATSEMPNNDKIVDNTLDVTMTAEANSMPMHDANYVQAAPMDQKSAPAAGEANTNNISYNHTEAVTEVMKPTEEVMPNAPLENTGGMQPQQTQQYPPQQQQVSDPTAAATGMTPQQTAPPPQQQPDLGPSLGVYTPESATNSVHSIHGGSFSNGGMGETPPNNQTVTANEATVHSNNVMESPNSISSVDLNNTNQNMQQNQQQPQQPQQQQQPSMQHYNPGASNDMTNLGQPPHVGGPHGQQQQQPQQHVPQASPHNPMTVPSPAASVASNVHPASLPSQSPHSQHNMTSPHPQPSPHQTSPHPMTISPAAHSPYQPQPPQPQPSPQPSVTPLGQSAARQPARSPQVQQHQSHQMHHIQHMSR